MHSLPAAQYLRMSTEHQQYSLVNQADAIARYAKEHAFVVVKTYDDPGKSGLQLRHRRGLRQLLEDVISGVQPYRAILVYDVSRWGRFQDTDEAAHYEFVCKQAGIPVHYCAETFPNDSSMPSLIMKTIKRIMAAEYSRELGVKTYAAKKRFVLLGFRQGAVPGFGLRRMVVSADGQRNRILQHGERKSLTTDRVILIPGAKSEVQIVREIYDFVVKKHMRVAHIARLLNERRVGGRTWTFEAVAEILRNPKYLGCNAWGRTSQKLHSPTVRHPKDQWIINKHAFQPLIDESTYEAAQRIMAKHAARHKMPDSEMLARLRRLLMKRGRLSRSIINAAYAVPSAKLYELRFGTIGRAYEMIGYGGNNHYVARAVTGRNTQRLRDELLESLALHAPRIRVSHQNHREKAPTIFLDDGTAVKVITCAYDSYYRPCWIVKGRYKKATGPFLLCLLNATKNNFEHLLLIDDLRNLNHPTRLIKGERWPDSVLPLEDIAQFDAAAARVSSRMRMKVALMKSAQ
jgi:DNA invertase Pin-like site-specific DNA recombinase